MSASESTQLSTIIPNLVTIDVALDERSYPIYLAHNAYTNPLLWKNIIQSTHVVIVSNETIAPLYAERLESLLISIDKQSHSLILKDGEQYKTLETFELIMTFLLEHNYHRDVTLIALGGGVIGDLVGFASACYQRGVPFVQCPTSLLAQVDSSVGGKTAVNHVLGKNMIGVFNQPVAVVIDPNCLTTLDKREFSSGLAEVIKYAILGDSQFFEWLENNRAKLFDLNYDSISYVISHCCKMKSDIVNQDEREHNVRALLNLGHTFGHAIEAYLGYGQWTHGEAVSAGMVMAATLSYQRGDLSKQDLLRIKALLKESNLPIWAPDSMRYDDFFSLMQRDKKVLANKIRFVLPESLGHAVLVDNIAKEELMTLINSSSAIE